MGKLTPKDLTDKELERAANATGVLSQEQRDAAAEELAKRNQD